MLCNKVAVVYQSVGMDNFAEFYSGNNNSEGSIKYVSNIKHALEDPMFVLF